MPDDHRTTTHDLELDGPAAALCRAARLYARGRARTVYEAVRAVTKGTKPGRRIVAFWRVAELVAPIWVVEGRAIGVALIDLPAEERDGEAVDMVRRFTRCPCGERRCKDRLAHGVELLTAAALTSASPEHRQLALPGLLDDSQLPPRWDLTP